MTANPQFSDQPGRDSEGFLISSISKFPPVSGENLYFPLLGSLVTKVALPSGSGKGPDTYVVDLSQYSSSDVRLVALYATGTVTHTADVSFSNDGQAGNVHTPVNLWTAVAGNRSAAIPKNDRFAHITITQVTGTAESVHYYTEGREIA